MKGKQQNPTMPLTFVRLFAVTIFLSAFLLFQVQPMISKYILPWFGSTPGVWATALLFFQLTLLAGYTYAHLLVSFLHWRRPGHCSRQLAGTGADRTAYSAGGGT